MLPQPDSAGIIDASNSALLFAAVMGRDEAARPGLLLPPAELFPRDLFPPGFFDPNYRIMPPPLSLPNPRPLDPLEWLRKQRFTPNGVPPDLWPDQYRKRNWWERQEKQDPWINPWEYYRLP
jgi:hypothetical protein